MTCFMHTKEELLVCIMNTLMHLCCVKGLASFFSFLFFCLQLLHTCYPIPSLRSPIKYVHVIYAYTTWVQWSTPIVSRQNSPQP